MCLLAIQLKDSSTKDQHSLRISSTFIAISTNTRTLCPTDAQHGSACAPHAANAPCMAWHELPGRLTIPWQCPV